MTKSIGAFEDIIDDKISKMSEKITKLEINDKCANDEIENKGKKNAKFITD